MEQKSPVRWRTRLPWAGFVAAALVYGYPYKATVSLPVGVNPHGVVAGDFNNDGRVDLAVANAGSDTVSVLLGNGNGSFQPKTDYAVQTRPKFTATGDVNGDGKVDLVTVNETTSSVTVSLGNGDGTFRAGIHSPAGCTAPHELAVGQLNADNFADIVVPCWNGDIISVLFGNGDGTFRAAVNYTTGTQPHSAVIADFNKDGRNDVAVANYQSNHVSVLLQNSAGGFATPVTYPTGSLPHFIRSADLNKDGNLDLVTANDGSDNVSVFLGNGSGGFAAARNFPAGSLPESVAIGDVDNDGNLDIVTANSGSWNVTVLLGNGAGVFVKAASFPAGNRAFCAILADLDGDRALDIVVANYGASDISILISLAVQQLPPGSVYLSSLPWTAMTNGYGPAERDTTNGEAGAGDGTTMKIRGAAFARGFGVHAASDIRFSVSGCSSFTAKVGVDDEVGGRGSVVFQVFGDAVKLFESPVLTGASAVAPVTVSIAGRSELRLVVTDGGDGAGYDHADWADAQIACGSDTTAPTVTSVTPAADATGVSPATAVTARFSEAMSASSISSATFVLTAQGSGTPVAASISYDGPTSTATLTPSALLAAGTMHNAVVKGGASGVKDAAGNALASDFTWRFTTGTQSLTALGDLSWTSAVNGWGPPERNRSNGEQGAADGNQLTLNGVGFSSGLGVHAPSDVRYAISGCSTFTSQIGVDDEVGNLGSVVFQVWGDSVMLYQSSTLTGASATQSVNVSLSGRSQLRLVVLDGGDNPNYDHADWAGGQLSCQTSGGPTVVSSAPAANATGVSPIPSVRATFSKAMNASTITSSTFTLTRSGSATPVTAAVSYDAATLSAALLPQAPLATGAVYNGVVKGGAAGVLDTGGGALASDYTWTFTVSSQATSWLSDAAWSAAANGWGPAERDMSNGEQGLGDGRPLTLNGVAFTKGFGVHAASELRFGVAGCSGFTAQVGVDDEVGNLGSVIFQVWGDSVKLFDSGVVTGASATQTATVSLAGRSQLRLVVTDGGDGINYDHADWAGAQLTCNIP